MPKCAVKMCDDTDCIPITLEFEVADYQPIVVMLCNYHRDPDNHILLLQAIGAGEMEGVTLPNA